jgi:hypothetical protein
MNTKVCTVCNATKDATKDYYCRSKDGKGFYETICKSCYKDQQNEKNRNKPTNERLFRSARSSSKKRGLAFTIKPEDIVVPDLCPILGIPLLKESQGRGGKPNSPSIDRIDNYKGYTKDNIWVISLKANKCKSDLTLEQLERMVIVLKEVTGG